MSAFQELLESVTSDVQARRHRLRREQRRLARLSRRADRLDPVAREHFMNGYAGVVEQVAACDRLLERLRLDERITISFGEPAELSLIVSSTIPCPRSRGGLHFLDKDKHCKCGFFLDSQGSRENCGSDLTSDV